MAKPMRYGGFRGIPQPSRQSRRIGSKPVRVQPMLQKRRGK